MNALRLMTGASVGMAALRVMACASLDRSWFGAMALWLKMVAVGAPLASTAGYAMRHEPCFLLLVLRFVAWRLRRREDWGRCGGVRHVRCVWGVMVRA